LFPLTFDTQFLAKNEAFKYVPQTRDERFGSMALGNLFKAIQEEVAAAKNQGKPTVEVSFAQGHDRYGPDCGAFHEAGYDAYATGYVFAHMAKQALSSELVDTLKGRSTMFRSLYHFNVSGEDELVAKGIYVHARGLKGRDDKYLREAFANIKIPGDENDEVEKKIDMEVRWMDEDSAFAIFPDSYKDAVSAILDRPKNEGSSLTCTSWNEWLSAQNATETAIADVDVQEPALKRARTST